VIIVAERAADSNVITPETIALHNSSSLLRIYGSVLGRPLATLSMIVVSTYLLWNIRYLLKVLNL